MTRYYFIAEFNINNSGKLEVKYYTDSGTSENPNDAKLYHKRQDAEFEVIKRDTEASVFVVDSMPIFCS